MGTRELNSVRRRIEAAALHAGRDPRDVQLLAVSKGPSDRAVREIYDAGQRAFGENRPGGLTGRLDGDLPGDIAWHFIGNVQRRAIKHIAPHIVLLHSFDRLSLTTPWSRIEDPPPVLIEVNIGEEPQKHGFAPADTLAAADAVASAGIPLAGLMVIPPRVTTPEDARRWFADLRDLGEQVRAAHPSAVHLSMGMTEDFEVAVEEGSTIVRVGRAIFEPTTGTDNAPTPED